MVIECFSKGLSTIGVGVNQTCTTNVDHVVTAWANLHSDIHHLYGHIWLCEGYAPYYAAYTVPVALFLANVGVKRSETGTLPRRCLG